MQYAPSNQLLRMFSSQQMFSLIKATKTLNESEMLRFTDKLCSSGTGLYYYFQRWYDSSTGRFVSEDPLPGRLSDPQSQNAYVYVQNLPTTAVDPTGMVQCEGSSAYCEGPGGRAWDQAQRDPNAICTDDPHACELCGDNPGLFSCNYSDPNTLGSSSGESGMGDPGSASSGGTGTPQYSAPPNPPTVEALSTLTIEIDTPSVEFMDPQSIRFTQNLVSQNFADGRPVVDLANGLSTGEIDPSSVPPIRVVEFDGNLYSLDN